MRKEVKSFSFLWWLVLAGLIAPSFFSRMNNDPSKKPVAHINGKVIDVARFKRQYTMMQSERQMFNQRYGLNLDLAVDPSLVIERSAESLLIDGVAQDQHLVVDPAVLSAMIRKSLSNLFGISKESFNVGLYNYYIRQSGMTVREFEEEQESTVRNSFVEDALHASAYVPRAGLVEGKDGKKSFAVLRFDKDGYIKQIKASTSVDDATLASFFEARKDHYKLPDIKRVSYVVIDPSSYSKQVSVNDEQIEAFYNRRKDSQFKDKDHYRMRRLLIAVPDGAQSEEVAAFEKKAQEFHAKIMANKDDFAEVAKTVSDDAKTAKKGGMTEDFTLGTSFGPEIEGALVKLANNGDVTPLVRTAEGFECAQLVHRKLGAYRSLDSARKEIISTLTQRAATELLRADIDAVMRDAQGGDVDLASFAKERHAKLEDTGDIDAAAAQGDGLKSEVARKVFGSFQSKPLQRGSFVFGDKHVVFAMTASEVNRYPSLADVKSKVNDDMIKKMAADALAMDVASARKAFFDEHKPLSEVAGLFKSASFHETAMIKKSDTIKGVEKDASVTASLFKLEDSSMLSKVTCKDGDIVLATLVAAEPAGSSDVAQGQDVSQTIQALGENLVTGFIASLKRNARIEVSDDQFTSGS